MSARTEAGRKHVFLAGSNPERRGIVERAVEAIEAEAGPLDAAWADVEAVMPEFWRIRSLISLSVLSDDWEVVVAEQGARVVQTGRGPTPLAALRDVAARLREPR